MQHIGTFPLLLLLWYAVSQLLYYNLQCGEMRNKFLYKLVIPFERNLLQWTHFCKSFPKRCAGTQLIPSAKSRPLYSFPESGLTPELGQRSVTGRKVRWEKSISVWSCNSLYKSLWSCSPSCTGARQHAVNTAPTKREAETNLKSLSRFIFSPACELA